MTIVDWPIIVRKVSVMGPRTRLGPRSRCSRNTGWPNVAALEVRYSGTKRVELRSAFHRRTLSGRRSALLGFSSIRVFLNQGG